METTRSATANVIDAISRDSHVPDDPSVVAAALAVLYRDNRAVLAQAIDDLCDDRNWSGDAEPYRWLDDVAVHLRLR